MYFTWSIENTLLARAKIWHCSSLTFEIQRCGPLQNLCEMVELAVDPAVVFVEVDVRTDLAKQA